MSFSEFEYFTNTFSSCKNSTKPRKKMVWYYLIEHCLQAKEECLSGWDNDIK